MSKMPSAEDVREHLRKQLIEMGDEILKETDRVLPMLEEELRFLKCPCSWLEIIVGIHQARRFHEWFHGAPEK